ncbi:hypothetical protein [Dyadobacter sp. LHD-138]|uniref:hypothetical protein n=1 Tax=Dyadobacter sp. LHD-138 TaxID=3071413 RepID=UPI0027E12C95|nr:hypothetical protein [Dyadobacter sp. LHD-138]MDQ6482250.1 hypothetical protein [Dyadobacter sp. LHD-138]
MNSSEQKDYENIRPTENEIEVTIQLINDILELPQIELLKNSDTMKRLIYWLKIGGHTARSQMP